MIYRPDRNKQLNIEKIKLNSSCNHSIDKVVLSDVEYSGLAARLHGQFTNSLIIIGLKHGKRVVMFAHPLHGVQTVHKTMFSHIEHKLTMIGCDEYILISGKNSM